MNITFDRLELATAMALILGAAAENNTVQSGVLIAADASGVNLQSTDGLLGVSVALSKCEVRASGKLLVPATRLDKIVRDSDSETISIETAKDSAYVKSGDSEFTLYTFNPESFPAWPAAPGSSVEVKLEDAVSLLSKAKVAVSRIEVQRFTFTGVCVATKRQKLVMVGTDARRLAKAICDAVCDGDDKQALVPPRAMDLLNRIKSGEPLKVAFTDNQIYFSCGNTMIRSVLLEGAFPAYDDHIPKKLPIRVAIDRLAFLAAVKRASLFEDADGSTRLVVKFSESVVRLKNAIPSAGTSNVPCPCKMEGSEITIPLNSKFLQDGLRAATSEQIIIEMSDPKSPAIIRDKGFDYVLTPINLDEDAPAPAKKPKAEKALAEA